MNLEEYLHRLKALSSPTRFRILNLLYQSGTKALTQYEIVETLQVPNYNISRHSKILIKANLIIQWKHGKHIYYHLTYNLKPKSILAVLKEFKKDSPLLKRDLTRLNKLPRSSSAS